LTPLDEFASFIHQMVGAQLKLHTKAPRAR